MGCFGVNGAISKLPIAYGEECVCILSLVKKEKEKPSPMNFGLGFTITPISLPIYGVYNDYGSIEDIVKDKNVEFIEEFFECNINELIELLDDNFSNRFTKSEKLYQYENILEKVTKRTNEFDLYYIIEHKYIYDSIIDLDADIFFDLEKSKEITCSIPYTLEGIKASKEFQKKYPSILEDLVSMDVSLFITHAVREKFDKANSDYRYRIVNLNPNFEDGVYRMQSYYDNKILMSLYKDNNVSLLLNELWVEYKRFLRFIFTLELFNWNLEMHNYCGQDGLDHLRTMKKHFEKILHFINEKVKYLD